MTPRAASRRQAPGRASRGPKIIGEITFTAVQDAPASLRTDAEELAAHSNELALLRLALELLQLDDAALEAKLRGMDGEGAQAMTEFHDGLTSLADRHRAMAEAAEAACARILVVFSRCLEGPRPASWAGDDNPGGAA